VAAIFLDEKIGHGQAQILPPLEPRADAAAAAITSGLVAREPPGVLFAGSGRRAPRFQESCHPFDQYTRGLEDMTNASLQRGR